MIQWLRIASQRRGHGFNPWLRKIPRAPEQLSPCLHPLEPVHVEPVLCNNRTAMRSSHRREKPERQNKEQPRSPRPEKTGGGSRKDPVPLDTNKSISLF